MTKKKRVDTEDEQDEGDWVDVKEEKVKSTTHHEERRARIQEENKANKSVANDLADNQEIANFKGLPQEGETREQLLDRIRKLRENPPHVEVELFRSEGLQKEYEAEVKAGQEAVAKAKAQQEQMMASLAKVEAGEKKVE